jgi:hypothetical protein
VPGYGFLVGASPAAANSTIRVRSTVSAAPAETARWARRYTGSASTWGFAIYRASHDDYHTPVLPSGYPAGTPQETLDCACGLYLDDTTAAQPANPTN